MSPYENVVIGNSFEEIVFSNRNKEYGAYVLRKSQKRYIIIAFLISFGFVSSAVVTTYIYNSKKGSKLNLNGLNPTVAVMDSTLKFDPPKPPDIKIEQAVNRFVVPKVMDTVINSDLNDIVTMEDLIATNIQTEAPVDIVAIVEEDPIIPVEERPFVTVEISAQFEGGNLNEFNKWVVRNIQYPQLAQENGITGKVIVQFVVNAKGKVENVTVLRGADPSLDQEAVRVISSSPKWSPPFQGGKAVKQLFSLPVNFKLE
ncbi:MAG: energy transducer TonB [Bacteroidales bacterium]|nr:energy transducer TonB [Bacteroidales bacterium]